jgi:hypothetical protein
MDGTVGTWARPQLRLFLSWRSKSAGASRSGALEPLAPGWIAARSVSGDAQDLHGWRRDRRPARSRRTPARLAAPDAYAPRTRGSRRSRATAWCGRVRRGAPKKRVRGAPALLVRNLLRAGSEGGRCDLRRCWLR